ncbi:MAG: substrate-binding domain-containing protein [Chloroflexi bacterium]|nr:substrate-binding domain-containing protein [Chloroflexota bacterium]
MIGADIIDLCDAVGGIKDGEDVKVTTKDNNSTTFSYKKITGNDFITYDVTTKKQVSHDTLKVVIAYEVNNTVIPDSEGTLKLYVLANDTQATDETWSGKSVTKLEISGGSVFKPTTRLRVATTTSLYDTGLWSVLEPKFEKMYNVELDVLYAGSGVAITYGKNGDVDVLTVHSPADEKAFIDGGFGVQRIWFAKNYFLIVGPANDPAGLKNLTPVDALKKLATNPGSGKFISRGDNSGTHSKEKALLKLAGYADYTAFKTTAIQAGWYIEAGSGMGPTLQKASELSAYTLTDIGTFLSYQSTLKLTSIVDKGSDLLNIYSVIVCTKSTATDPVKLALANNMVTFLTSTEIQKLIGEYGLKDYGQQLFIPVAGQAEPTS